VLIKKAGDHHQEPEAKPNMPGAEERVSSYDFRISSFLFSAPKAHPPGEDIFSFLFSVFSLPFSPFYFRFSVLPAFQLVPLATRHSLALSEAEGSAVAPVFRFSPQLSAEHALD